MSIDDISTNYKQIDIKHLIPVLLKRWLLILSIILVCVILSLIYSIFIATPFYDSTAKIYIMNKSSQNISAGDLSVSTYLAKDYEELIVDRVVLGKVSKNLNNKYSYEYLKSAINIDNPENTRFLVITVRTENAKASKEIVDMICEISQGKIVELMGIDRVSIISKGNLPTRTSSPNVQLNLIKSLIIGIVISIIIIFISYLSDDKIDSPEDIENYLGTSVLGVIPFNSNRTKPNK